MNRRIGFVSTRLKGTDGVSLEADKWVKVLEERLGHTCFFFAGELNQPAERSRLVPEAHFLHPEIDAIHQVTFSNRTRPPGLSKRIQQIKDHLKEEITAFVREFDIELLIVENALSIPVNIPLGLALTEYIIETGFPTIAHHHDFFWERNRFLVNCVWDYLNTAFPPNIPFIWHVVINSLAANQLSLRRGVSSKLIPNVIDFDQMPPEPDEYTLDLRQALGVKPGEWLFLQPTRVVPRKGIEHAIELTWRMDLKARLVISHASGDEGFAYERRLREYAELLGVPVNFVSDIIQDERGTMPDGRKIYSLWDVYPYADLVTYPSTLEGFGNAFLEAVYFRKPIVLNNYSIFAIDIKPKGFQVIEFDGFINDEIADRTRRVLENPELIAEMTEHNYQLAKRHYSLKMLEWELGTLLVECFGEEDT